jgi:hypothetical protein
LAGRDLDRIRRSARWHAGDIHGPDHGFHAYIDGLSRNLHTQGRGLDGGGLQPSSFQRAISSIHRYPFLTVIEKRDTELDRLIAPKHGTRWEPFYGEAETFPG